MGKSFIQVDIGLTGDKELQKILDKLATKDAKQIVRQALRVGSKPILKRTQALARQFTKTGELYDTIKLHALKRSRKRFGVAITAGSERKGRGGVIKGGGIEGRLPPSVYASYVELGTDKQPAQSFLRRARDEGQAKFDRDMANLIGDAVEKAAKKSAKKGAKKR